MKYLALTISILALTITGCQTVEVTPLTVEDRLLEPIHVMELEYE